MRLHKHLYVVFDHCNLLTPPGVLYARGAGTPRVANTKRRCRVTGRLSVIDPDEIMEWEGT
jgi:hypothetical protein